IIIIFSLSVLCSFIYEVIYYRDLHFSLFFSLRLPPLSRLFPYTTLFRSSFPLGLGSYPDRNAFYRAGRKDGQLPLPVPIRVPANCSWMPDQYRLTGPVRRKAPDWRL